MSDELFAVDPRALPDGALADHVAALEAAQVRLDAARMAALAEVDARQVHAADGAASMAAWLTQRFGTAGAAGREQTRVACRLRSMPATAAAFAAEDLPYATSRRRAGVIVSASASAVRSRPGRLQAMTGAARTVVEGLGFSEGPRWHDGRLWFSDMGAPGVFALDPASGAVEEVHRVPTRPSGLGWLPDGRLLVVSMTDRRVLLADGTDLVEHADLSALASFDCNDMVVDGRGNAYVGNAGFDLSARPLQPRPAEVILVRPDGSAEVVDDRVMFPNGSVVTPDGKTLVVAETFGACLTAFAIGADGGLAERRTWASIPGAAPDGICGDADGAIWVADATSGSCLRVAEGGDVLDRVDVGPQRAFACALGGNDRRTLFVCAADDFGGKAIARRTGRIVAFDRVDAPGAGWP